MTGTRATIPEGADVMRLLYPRSGSAADRDSSRFVALPGTRDPRMYMPMARIPGSRALLRARRFNDRRQQARTWAVSGLLALGLGRVVSAPMTLQLADSIEEHLARILDRPVTIAVFLGPRRANRKPVLQVMDERGTLLAVAKVGVNNLTSALAHQEARALELVTAASVSSVISPSLLARSEWQGHAMVVQSPLDLTGGLTPLDPQVVERAMVQIARIGGVYRRALGGSGYFVSLRGQVDGMYDHPRARRAGLDLLRSLDADLTELPFGAWHGDLTPWNIATRDGRALVWDWERFAEGVPLGIDSLHHQFLPALTSGAPRESVAVDLMRRASRGLAPHGVAPGDASVVAGLYLLEIASRFSGDGQAASGKPAGDVESWLLPAIELLRNDRRA